MEHYIDADRLRAEIDRRMTENCELAEKAGGAFGQRAVEDNDILAIIDSLQQDEKAVELEMCSQAYWEERGWMMIPPDVTLKGIESLLEQVRKKLQQEQSEVDLEKEIKRYTEEKYKETFGNGQGTLDEFDWEDIVSVIEDTARYFYNPQPHWKPSEEQMRFLLAVINEPNNAGSESCHLVLKELYEQLKTL